MMTCAEATNRFWEYLDESLAGPHREVLEAHLGLCRQCCGELELARVLRGHLASQPIGESLPEDVRGRIDLFLQELSHE
ncbi:MAG: zf-HC2 protein [Chloroflexi bacterium]|nr:zf-HC2 protein [Chloroflexota bacterium]